MKLLINMLSKADSVEGQGVGSAYIEQVNLVKEELSEYFDVRINSKKKADIV
ncbi:glycosyltransferase, partial [bacterium]|nr:glycosyltransferase [bacterium]